jgi:hypothetical protein
MSGETKMVPQAVNPKAAGYADASGTDLKIAIHAVKLPA